MLPTADDPKGLRDLRPLLMHGGTSTYRALVLDDGWSADRFEKWLHAALVKELLG